MSPPPPRLQDVWQLLMSVTQAPGQDRLAMAAISFLTAVARSVHSALLADPATLRQVCESIVIPNLRMREDMVRRTHAGGRAGRAHATAWWAARRPATLFLLPRCQDCVCLSSAAAGGDV